MRAPRGVSMLAATAAITLAGSTPAYALDSQAPVGIHQPPAAVIGHHSSNSPEWLLIALAGGGITLTAASVGASRVVKHATRTPAGV